MKFVNMTILFITMMTFITIMGIDNSFGTALHAVGINVGAGAVQDSQVVNSGFWETINSILLITGLVGAAGAVIAGLFGKTININLLVVPMATFCVGNFASVSWTIIDSVSEGWAKAILALVFLPLGVMYLMAAVEFFFGTE